MKVAVGQDIESVCSRCETSWHVVVAIVDANVLKVECKQCHNVHQHRGKKVAAPKKPRAASGKKSARGAAARPQVEANLQKPVRKYAIGESFEPGERVDHATFGAGVVQHSPGPGKIEILFGDQIKLLSQAKPISRRFSP
jgi:hypothetical protein